jgi:hypothetical protein
MKKGRRPERPRPTPCSSLPAPGYASSWGGQNHLCRAGAATERGSLKKCIDGVDERPQ